MKRVLRFVLPLIILLYAVCALAVVSSIVPGDLWYDTSNNLIEAHGGGILKVGNTYYWYGEDRSNGSPTQTVSCYSSTNLMNWKFETHSLSTQSSGDLAAGRIVERPKVIYNAATAKYVMYMHIDNSNYSEAKVGVATCATPNGQFTYLKSFQPNGHQSRDMTIFQDGTNAWLISLGEDSSGKINQNDRIYPLSSDYLSVQPETYTFANAGREGLSVMKAGSYYFICSSACSGWSPNQQKYTYSTSMNSGWNTTWTNVGNSNGYVSQTNFLLPVAGSSTTSYIYMGDRWNSGMLSDSRYVWLPLTVSGHTLTLNWYPSWLINTSTGMITGTTAAVNYLKNLTTGLYIDGMGRTSNGSNAGQYTSSSSGNQQWCLEPAGSYYKIRNMATGLYLDGMGRTADGSICCQYAGTSSNNQQWQKVTSGSYVKFMNRATGLYLDGAGATSNGADLKQYSSSSSANQQWQIQ